MNLYDKIGFLYRHASPIRNADTNFTFEDDEQKLFIATHTMLNKSIVKSGRWWIDWALVGDGNKDSANSAWKEFCKRKGNGTRHKTFLPQPELFEQNFPPELFDKDESNEANVHRIYEQTGKIFHRDTINAYRKSHTSRATAHQSKYNDKQVEAIIGQLKKMPGDGCEVVLKYLISATANKQCRSVTLAVPTWMPELYKKLENSFQLMSGTLDMKKFTTLTLLGFELCEFEMEELSSGDYGNAYPIGYYSFDGLRKEFANEGLTIPDLCLAIREPVLAARVCGTQINKTYIHKNKLKDLTYTITEGMGNYGISYNKLKPLVMQNWNEHSTEFGEWLANPANFKPYHCYRKNSQGEGDDAVWKFNLLAICLSIYNDLGLRLSPVTLQLILDIAPNKIEGSPLTTPGGVTMVLKQ